MKRFYVYATAFGLTASTALAGGYVAPVIPYEPAYVKPVEKPKFSWTGPYVGAHVGHTKLKLNKSNIVNHDAEVIEHPAITEIVEIPHEAVTTEVDVPAETTTILHPAETETTVIPPVMGKREVTIDVPGGEVVIPKYIVHDPEYGTETVTVGKLIATKDAELPEGYKLSTVEADGNKPGYFYVEKENGEYAYGEANGAGLDLSAYHDKTTYETTVITKPGYVEETTETIITPPGKHTYEEVYVKEEGRVETEVVKEAWEEVKILKPAGTETVVVKPGYIEEKVVEVKPAWTEVVRAAYTSALVQELKESANTYGVFGGYRYQYRNSVVVGVEANYSKSSNISASFDDKVYDFDLNTFSIEAQAGYAYKRFLPYVGLGYASTDGDGALMASVGVDYAVTDNIIIGAKYTHYKYDDLKTWNADADTVSVRVGYKF